MFCLIFLSTVSTGILFRSAISTAEQMTIPGCDSLRLPNISFLYWKQEICGLVYYTYDSCITRHAQGGTGGGLDPLLGRCWPYPPNLKRRTPLCNPLCYNPLKMLCLYSIFLSITPLVFNTLKMDTTSCRIHMGFYTNLYMYSHTNSYYSCKQFFQCTYLCWTEIRGIRLYQQFLQIDASHSGTQLLFSWHNDRSDPEFQIGEVRGPLNGCFGS